MSSEHPAAVVFDFDGVLVDSVDIKTTAFVALYENHDDEVVEQVRRFHLENGGVSRYRKLEHFERELLGRNPGQEAIEELAQHFSRLVVEKVVAAPEMPGATDLLRHLAQRWPVFVASGTPEEELREIVRRRGWESHFAGVFGTPRDKAELLRAIAEQLGVEPERLVMVGDALTDLEGSRAVGARFVGYAPNDDRFPPTETIVTDLDQLPRLLEEAALSRDH